VLEADFRIHSCSHSSFAQAHFFLVGKLIESSLRWRVQDSNISSQCTRFNKVGSLRWCTLEVLISEVLGADFGSILVSHSSFAQAHFFLVGKLMESSLRWRVQDSNISINAHTLTKLVPLGGVGLKC